MKRFLIHGWDSTSQTQHRHPDAPRRIERGKIRSCLWDLTRRTDPNFSKFRSAAHATTAGNCDTSSLTPILSSLRALNAEKGTKVRGCFWGLGAQNFHYVRVADEWDVSFRERCLLRFDRFGNTFRKN